MTLHTSDLRQDHIKRGLENLIWWHHLKAWDLRRSASITAADYPELSMRSIHLKADWHSEQARLLESTYQLEPKCVPRIKRIVTWNTVKRVFLTWIKSKCNEETS